VGIKDENKQPKEDSALQNAHAFSLLSSDLIKPCSLESDRARCKLGTLGSGVLYAHLCDWLNNSDICLGQKRLALSGASNSHDVGSLYSSARSKVRTGATSVSPSNAGLTDWELP
jgi:hypothetical protein